MKNIIILFFLTAFISCNKSNTSKPASEQWVITKVEGADVGSIDQQVPLTVYYPTSSGCDVLDTFTETPQNNIILIKAFGHTEKGICTQDAPIKTRVFNFVSSDSGTFELRFVNADNSYISHTITIN